MFLAVRLLRLGVASKALGVHESRWSFMWEEYVSVSTIFYASSESAGIWVVAILLGYVQHAQMQGVHSATQPTAGRFRPPIESIDRLHSFVSWCMSLLRRGGH